MILIRFVAAGALALALTIALTGPACADPIPGGALALPRTEGAPTHFGFSGTRPLDASTDSGVVRPTPAPCVEARGFGFARASALRARPAIVQPTPSPCLEARGEEPFVPCRDEVVVRGAGTLTIDGRCNTGCGTCGPGLPPTTRIADDPLSVPTTFWSSGYHDGKNARCDPCDPCRTRCDPCRTTCEPLVSTCDPCVTTCEPHTTRVVYRRAACAPRRVYRRCDMPCSPCGPRVYARPCCGPVRYGCGPYRPYYGCGPRYGYGCGPRYGCGIAPAAAAVGLGIGLALPFLGCW